MKPLVTDSFHATTDQTYTYTNKQKRGYHSTFLSCVYVCLLFSLFVCGPPTRVQSASALALSCGAIHSTQTNKNTYQIGATMSMKLVKYVYNTRGWVGLCIRSMVLHCTALR